MCSCKTAVFKQRKSKKSITFINDQINEGREKNNVAQPCKKK